MSSITTRKCRTLRRAWASWYRDILCHWWVDEWCNIFKIYLQCKLTRWTPHCLTPCQWIHWMRQTPHHVLVWLTSVRSDRLPSCSLWCLCCSLTPEAICLSHSVDSSALSYTVRSPPSQSITQNIARVQIWNVCVPSFPFVEFKFSVYGHTYADRQTYTHILQCSHASVGFTQACPNYIVEMTLKQMKESAFLRMQMCALISWMECSACKSRTKNSSKWTPVASRTRSKSTL